MTGRRSHWTERGDDNIFYVWPLWCVCSFSGCKWAYCHGTLLCEFSIPKCGGVLGGNDQNRAEKQNVVLTWFRPVTRSSGHLGRRIMLTQTSRKSLQKRFHAEACPSTVITTEADSAKGSHLFRAPLQSSSSCSTSERKRHINV